MTAIKIARFAGIAPKIAPEHLPDTQSGTTSFAQDAVNVKITSGDLLPFNDSIPFGDYTLGLSPDVVVQTIFGVRSENGDLDFLAFTNITRVVVAEDSDRIYYADGVNPPKVTTIELALDGGKPYPAKAYNLGLPLPDTVPSVNLIPAEEVATVSYARDAGSTATLVTATNHNLRTGSVVAVSGFKGYNPVTVRNYARTNNVATITTLRDHNLETGDIITILGFPRYTPIFSATIKRESNVATITTGVLHNLRSGDIVNITAFSGDDSDFNDNDVTVSVLNPVTFTYSNSGSDVDQSTNVDGRIELIVKPEEFNTERAVITKEDDVSFTFDNVGDDVAVREDSAGRVDLLTRPDTFNVRGVSVTKVNDTTIQYFNPGEQIATRNDTDGRVVLSARASPRSYVYTWVTPWGEESVPSEPTGDLLAREGETVIVGDLPDGPPSPTQDNFIRGIRLYRTLATPAGADYFRLLTIWFPLPLARAGRQSNVITVTTSGFHNLLVGDRVLIDGATDSNFNTPSGGAIVTKVVNRLTFEFQKTGINIAEKVETGGILYYDAAETVENAPRFWGFDNDFDFTDDFNSRDLTFLLRSETFSPPPEDLDGLVSIQNNILAGFSDNKVYFSEPGDLHAWPAANVITFEYRIKGLSSVAGELIVLTEGYPYRLSGSDPRTITKSRIDAFYPCVSKNSIVNMGYGVLYATHGGLALYNPVSGSDIITKFLFDWDDWAKFLDPETIAAVFYSNKYFASHGSDIPFPNFVFERDDRSGGFFVKLDFDFAAKVTATWVDPLDNTLYYNLGDTNQLIGDNKIQWDGNDVVWATDSGDATLFWSLSFPNVVFQFDKGTVTEPVRWRSKRYVIPIPTNMGVGKIITEPVDAKVKFTLFSGTDDRNRHEQVVEGNKFFRLPRGYKSDTFSIELDTFPIPELDRPARIKAVYIASVQDNLKQV